MGLDEIKVMRLKDLAEDTIDFPKNDALHGHASIERLAVRAVELSNGVLDLLEELERLKKKAQADHEIIVLTQKERDGYKFAAEPPDPVRAHHIRAAVEAVAELRAERFRLTELLREIGFLAGSCDSR